MAEINPEKSTARKQFEDTAKLAGDIKFLIGLPFVMMGVFGGLGLLTGGWVRTHKSKVDFKADGNYPRQ